jgi:hypothetical protein
MATNDPLSCEHYTSHHDEIGASLFNVAMQRANQLGREFLTAEEHRLVRACTKFYMEMKPVDMSLVIGRPQVQAQQPPAKVLDHVEAAIQKAADDEVAAQNAMKQEPINNITADVANQTLTEPGPDPEPDMTRTAGAVDLDHDPSAPAALRT